MTTRKPKIAGRRSAPTQTPRSFPWTEVEAIAFLDAVAQPASVADADRPTYLVMRDALVVAFKPTGAVEAFVVRDLAHNELQIWRYDRYAERLRRHHEAAAIGLLTETFYPANPAILGRQPRSSRLEMRAIGSCARRTPEGLQEVGGMLAEADLDAHDVDAAAFEVHLEQEKLIMGLRAGCEARRRALMQDIAEWRRGGFGSPPEVLARCSRALRDALVAYGLKR